MTYPVSLSVDTPDRIANWRPLVHWFLLIPHFIVLWALSYVTGVLWLISWASTVLLGRLPGGIARFQIMSMRYNARVAAYFDFMNDQYPPFDFTMTADDPGGNQTSLSVSPMLDGHSRAKALFRPLLMIPAFVFAFIVWIIAGVCWVLGFLAVLFTGRWPQGLRRWVFASILVQVRVGTYANFLTDEYPPFSIE